MNQTHGVPKHHFIFATIHQLLFRAEHLRHLGQQRRAAAGNDAVGQRADHRIGRQAGKPIRPAALEAEHELILPHLLPHILRRPVDQLMQQRKPFRHFVVCVLADQKFHALRIAVFHTLSDFFHTAVLAAQPQHQHAARVGMAGQRRQRLPRVFLIVPQLRAAVRVLKGEHIGHAAVQIFPRLLCETLRRLAHASHGGQNPDFVANAHTTVRPHKAPESARRSPRQRAFRGMIDILLMDAQRRAQVVRMHPFALVNIAPGQPDAAAVFDDLAALRNIAKRHFVSRRNLSLCLQAHGNIVARMNLQFLFHAPNSPIHA